MENSTPKSREERELSRRDLLSLAATSALLGACGAKTEEGSSGSATGKASSTGARETSTANRPLAGADPRDDAFRTWALALGAQLKDAASGKEVDPTLTKSGTDKTLGGAIDAKVAEAVAGLPAIHAVVVTMIGVRDQLETCSFNVAAWSDERKTWAGGPLSFSGLNVAKRSKPSDKPTVDWGALKKEMPALVGMWERALAARGQKQRLPPPPKDVTELLGNMESAAGSALQRGEAFDVTDKALADPKPWALDLIQIRVFVGKPADSLSLMQTLAREVGVYVEPNGADVYLTPPTVKIVR